MGWLEEYLKGKEGIFIFSFLFSLVWAGLKFYFYDDNFYIPLYLEPHRTEIIIGMIIGSFLIFFVLFFSLQFIRDLIQKYIGLKES